MTALRDKRASPAGRGEPAGVTPGSSSRRGAFGALVAALVALLPVLYLRGFTVDDALIPARYAAHIASGAGYRWNTLGPVTDGVTPLGWAYLLAPFAAGGPLKALLAAKWIGAVAWIASAGALGSALAHASARPVRFAALALIAASAPLGAWSAAGLETGVVLAFGALAAALPELGAARAGAACAGLAAALRPELLPWALVLSAASAFGLPLTPAIEPPSSRASQAHSLVWRRAALQQALASMPFFLVIAVRWAVFGRPGPLSALAKPPDFELGAKYALACFLLTGPVALLAPIGCMRVGLWPRGLIAAVLAHFAAVALAGGDWMPLSRLVVPVLPTVALAAAHLASAVDSRVALARIALAVAGQLFVFIRIGPTAAAVLNDRLAVLGELRKPLAPARVVAALDIGWLGAATDATVVDLAGVTDPTVAALPGGHTTKQIPVSFFDAREVDTIVLLLDEEAEVRMPWTQSRFARGVELRIARFPGIEGEFQPIATSSVKHLRYLVLRRAPDALATGLVTP